MVAYLLAWKSRKGSWDNLAEEIADVAAGRIVRGTWNSGNGTNICNGDRLVLLRQGAEPRGVIAPGWPTGNCWVAMWFCGAREAVISSTRPEIAKWLRASRCGTLMREHDPCLQARWALNPASIHMKKNTTLIVATVPGFDPNRPDLQEFLNNLAAEELGEEPSTPRTPRRAKRTTRTGRTAPSGAKRGR
jgi:hypothetical protein